jgi:hypothetical protein
MDMDMDMDMERVDPVLNFENVSLFHSFIDSPVVNISTYNFR